MKTLPTRLTFCLILVLTKNLFATTIYVNISNTVPVSPFTTWATAATNIQNAIDVSSDGDLVLVSDGVYATGGEAYYGTNRVVVNKAITVQSIDGPNETIIVGTKDPQTTNGTASVRCVGLGAGATLSGFTLTNGSVSGYGGGGIFCLLGNSTVYNCVIQGNSTDSVGGGGANGTYINCIISDNTSSTDGGGLNNPSLVKNCIISKNTCYRDGGGCNMEINGLVIMLNSLIFNNYSQTGYGGGVNAFSTVNIQNCTIVANYGGGAYNGSYTNCIIYYNYPSSLVNFTNFYNINAYNCCVFPTNRLAGANNFANPPGFANLDNQDFHLTPWSSCVDSGYDTSNAGTTDLDGNPRVVGQHIDAGAYEYQEQWTNTIHYVMLTNKYAAAPFTNWMIAATNIQDAIDIATPGDFIIVSNGVYSNGGHPIYGSITNRIAVTKSITVQGLQGLNGTLIQGLYGLPGIRCVYLTNNAVLIGLTLTNGEAQTSPSVLTNENGGDVWCESTSATLSNCVLTTGIAINYGGGAYSGTLVNCTITQDRASSVGGGSFGSTLMSCLVSNNTATSQGGGACGGILTSCLIVTNNSSFGGGACSNILNNCIINNNWAKKIGGGTYFCLLTNCTLFSNSATNGGGAAYGVLSGCGITNNKAYNGGGSYSNILYNCNLTYNYATNNGGGSYLANLTNCIIGYNSAGSFGGGAGNCVLSNCTLLGNYAEYGGGVYASTVINSIFNNTNMAVEAGGGALYSSLNCCYLLYCKTLIGQNGQATANCTLNGCRLAYTLSSNPNNSFASYSDILNNCVLFGNRDGGAQNSYLNNCTVLANGYLLYNPGGTYQCYVTNSIIYSNRGYNSFQDTLDHCCVQDATALGPGCFTNNPAFLDLTHLQSNSPCVDAGNNSTVNSSVDFDGRPRIINGTVDIGATEFQGANIEPFIVWLAQYNLPDDGSADYADSDGDGMNNYQEWIAGTNPTNNLSLLEMYSPVYSNASTEIVVSWQSVTNVTYYLQRSSDLTAAFSSIQSNIIGQAGTTSFTDANATNNNSFFYRVGVQ